MSSSASVFIPLAGFGAYADAGDSQPAAKIPRPMRVLEPRTAQNPRILLIDDDATFCLTMTRIAKRLKFPVQQLEALTEAEQLSYWNYDLVIIDFDLGERSGVEVAADLQDAIGDVPVVLVSGSERAVENRDQWPDVIKGFVSKDQSAEEILDAALKIIA